MSVYGMLYRMRTGGPWKGTRPVRDALQKVISISGYIQSHGNHLHSASSLLCTGSWLDETVQVTDPCYLVGLPDLLGILHYTGYVPSPSLAQPRTSTRSPKPLAYR